MSNENTYEDIEFPDIREGDTIVTEYDYAGAKHRVEGVATTKRSPAWSTGSHWEAARGAVLARSNDANFYGYDSYTLKRLVVPLPTEFGARIRLRTKFGGLEAGALLVRVGNEKADYPWAFKSDGTYSDKGYDCLTSEGVQRAGWGLVN